MTEKLLLRLFLLKRPNETIIQQYHRHLRLSRECPRSVKNSYELDKIFIANEEDKKVSQKAKEKKMKNANKTAKAKRRKEHSIGNTGATLCDHPMVTGL